MTASNGRYFLLGVVLAWLAGAPAVAQTSSPVPPPSTEAEQAEPEATVDTIDPLGRRSPAGTGRGFVAAADRQDFVRAAEYFDLRHVPTGVREINGEELARMLWFVAQRTLWGGASRLSEQPEGDLADGLPEHRELAATLELPHQSVDIYLQRSQNAEGQPIWLIAGDTLAQIPDLYASLQYPDWIEWVHTWMPEHVTFLGWEGFKWVILLATLLVAWPLGFALMTIILRLATAEDTALRPVLRRLLTGPVLLLAVLLVGGLMVRYLGAGVTARQYFQAHTLLILAATWLAWALISAWRDWR